MRGGCARPRVIAIALALLGALVAPAAAGAAPRPFGNDCRAVNGVRFCPAETLDQRVPSFDGVPLDVDVTLPPSGDGSFPTIVMLHGYGGNKSNNEATSPEGRGAGAFHYNNVYFAQRGYAVLTYTARGFGRSCGEEETMPTAGCGKGFIRLADTRYEARDTQYLLGLLADQGVTQPTRIGVTGGSYGGGQSVELAFLHDRIRLPDGSLRPWRSPDGARMRVAAAFPRIPWSDLAYSLLPNGRFLDFLVSPRDESRSPVGVPLQSFLNGLYLLGRINGYYCGDAPASSPCRDPSADVNRQFAEVTRGEPVTSTGRRRLDEIYNFKSGISVPGRPAPLLIENGWTDDLFPPHEALRVYNRARSYEPAARVSLMFGDLGHMRGANKANTLRDFNQRGSRFFDAYLKGEGAPPRPGSVVTYTQTCPTAAPAAGPFTAPSWTEIHPGAVRFASRAQRTVTSTGGNPATARSVDPVPAGTACATTPDETAPGTAVYRGPRSAGFTLMGRPTVSARVQATGRFGQLDSRLWDVAPDGTQTLVSRAAYRLTDDQAGPVVFQLNGNGYRFARGHRPKLELLGRDAAGVATLGTLGGGYLRPSNGTFTVRVSDVEVELPTRERPDGEQIAAPRLGVAPAISLAASPSSATAGRSTRFTFRATLMVGGRSRVATGTTVTFAGSSGRVNADGRVAFVRRFATPGRAIARASNGLSTGSASVPVGRAAQPGFTG